MQPFDVLGNPVRRRILELLAEGARTSGEIVEAIQREFDISQPGVSQHLRVLRDTNFASSRVDGQRRIYELAGRPLAEVDAWLDRLRGAWAARLDALATEIARGQRERRLAEPRKTTARRRA